MNEGQQPAKADRNSQQYKDALRAAIENFDTAMELITDRNGVAANDQSMVDELNLEYDDPTYRWADCQTGQGNCVTVWISEDCVDMRHVLPYLKASPANAAFEIGEEPDEILQWLREH